MYKIIVECVFLIIIIAILISIYQNKILYQVNCEMTNDSIDVNNVNFTPKNIINGERGNL